MSADVMLREPPPPVCELAPPLVRRIEAPPVRKFQPPGRALMTLEEYFVFMEATDFRVEYIDGEIFIKGPVRLPHSLVQTNLVVLFRTLLPYENYPVFSDGIGIRRRLKGRFVPDSSVARDPARLFEGSHDLSNPALIVAALSPSTRPRVKHHRRVGENWMQREYTDLDDIVNLDSFGASMSLAQIYRGIDFPQS